MSSLLDSNEYADLIPLEDFFDLVAVNALIPDDGSGYWATEEGHNSDLSVWSSKRPAWATHVAWFNC